LLFAPVQQFTNLHQLSFTSFQGKNIDVMVAISKANWILLAVVVSLWGIRKLVQRKKTVTIASTWGCGYTAPTAKIQYTASSFVKTYTKLFGTIFLIHRKEKEVEGIFPAEAHHETHPYDIIEHGLIDYPIRKFKEFLSLFLFFQNGKLQFYIIYGILFIVSVILLPLIYDAILLFIESFKQL
ncbi:MAG: hypothetical protein PHI48_03860, partial [Bacteroidales bacterium]|nr:hypothetical protein [Bacteroidales bacterium]